MNWFQLHKIDLRLKREADPDCIAAVHAALDAIEANPHHPDGVDHQRHYVNAGPEALIAWLPGDYFLVYEPRAQSPMPHAGPCIIVRRFARMTDLDFEIDGDE